MKAIELFGEIGQSWFSNGWTLERMRDELRNAAGTVRIELKSNGGDLLEAFAIRDELERVNARVEVDVIGAAASAATVIATAADYVRISPNARYLVHNSSMWPEGRLTKEVAGEIAERLASFDEQIIRTYVKRTGKTAEEIQALMLKEVWLTAEEAVSWGFADEIIKPIIINKMDDKDTIIEQLTQENEVLKQQIDELKAKLAEMETEKLTEEVGEAGLEGEAAQAMVELGKVNAEAMRRVLAALPKPERKPLVSVPAPAANNGGNPLAEFKAGKITFDEYLKRTKKQ